jgi:hypothetical protein
MTGSDDRTWTIRKKRPEPFDTEFGSIVGPAADFPVEVVPVARLRSVLGELEEAERRAERYLSQLHETTHERDDATADLLDLRARVRGLEEAELTQNETIAVLTRLRVDGLPYIDTKTYTAACKSAIPKLLAALSVGEEGGDIG